MHHCHPRFHSPDHKNEQNGDPNDSLAEERSLSRLHLLSTDILGPWSVASRRTGHNNACACGRSVALSPQVSYVFRLGGMIGKAAH